MNDIHLIAPLVDARWDAFVGAHPRATVFHSRGWLQALADTYGYEPFVLTTTAKGPLVDGLVACRVRTLLARRVVSLPFSDHCEPLVDDVSVKAAFTTRLQQELHTGRARSIEVRARSADCLPGLANGGSYYLHALDLAPPLTRIFEGFDASNTRRAVRRAEREGLRYESGSSEPLLERFFAMLRQTRRRHGVPPQPVSWFRNLMASLRDALEIHVASKDSRTVAAMLTISFGRTMVYKYGGSDASQHRLGGMPFLFWQAIQSAHARGIEMLDLGRSDFDQPGLIAFKDHLGAVGSRITYQVAPPAVPRSSNSSSLVRTVGRAIAHLPDPLFDLTGRLAYRHLG